MTATTSDVELGASHDDSTKLIQRRPSDSGATWWKLPKDKVCARLIYMFYFASLSSTEPYYSVYYKQKGFSPSQIGIFFGIRPVLGFIASPFWGMLGDNFKIRHILFFVVWIGWMTFVAALGFYPYPDRATSCPAEIHCNVTGLGNVTSESAQDMPCDTRNLSEHQLDDLNSSLGWIYDESSLFTVLFTMGFLVLASELFQAPVGAYADTMGLKVVKSSPETGQSLYTYGSVRLGGSTGWAIS